MVLREKIKYDTSRWDFRKVIERYLGSKNLESLHEKVNYEVFERKNDQSSIFHKEFYGMYDIDNEFDLLYREWVINFISPYIGDDKLIYQTRPSFRIHLSNNLAVGEWHRDSDYNHSRSIVNFFVPMTNSTETSTIWCESQENKADYRPVNLKYGEALAFSGGILKHGNFINQTGKTRVSFDCRILRRKDYKHTKSTSINSSKRFIIGEYYQELK